jgi:hypothetical protein
MSDPLTPAAQAARGKAIAGLRQLADYLDQHPSIPAAEFGWTLIAFAPHDTDAEGRAEVDHVAAALGVQPDDNTADRGHYTAARAFGPITYEFIYVTIRRRAAHEALMSYAGAVEADAAAPADDPPEAA